ncbi:MAG TPA: sigma factor [Kofleriaceae bacterium]
MGEDAESVIADSVRARSFDLAATRIFDAYGAELFGFLTHLLGNESDAGEVFSQVAEDLWKGLPTYALRCTARTWIYVLGRHAASRYRRTPWNRGERRTTDSRIASMVDLARSRTQPWLRTEVKDKFRMLRDSLDDDDRTLLALRVDRDLAWEEIALVMLGVEDPEPKQVTRETDRLRKRFQLLKADLRKKALEAGLLDEKA